MHEPPVPRPERLRRAVRLTKPKVWRSLLLGVSDPANDPHWQFVERSGTDRYLHDPEPWLAPGAVALLEGCLQPGMSVFEWGAGSSTLWFVSRGCCVTSYETDPPWIDCIQALARGAADIRHIRLDDDYAMASLEGASVVLVDGRRRRECALHAAKNGEDGQLVILDDSHRSEYAEGCQALSQRATSQQHFPGLTAMMTPKMTSAFWLG